VIKSKHEIRMSDTTSTTNDEPHPLIGVLLEEDLQAIEQAIAAGWDINSYMRLDEYSQITAVNLALTHQKEKLLDFLLARKPDMNPSYDPPLIHAIYSGCSAKTLQKLVTHGARLDGVNQVGVNAYHAAIHMKQYDLLPEIYRLGLPLDADGAVALRSAAFNRQFEAVKFFVEHGIDVNARKPDMVHPDNPSTVAVAARNGDMEMVKYLVEHGADVMLTNEYGDRAYTSALAAEHYEVAEYLKGLEPPEWHTEAYHLRRIEGYALPSNLVDLLRSKERRIPLEGCYPKYIEFHPLEGVKELNWKGTRLLDLLAKVDDYWETGYLVWSPKHQKIAHADYEHDHFAVLCTWKNFIANPSKWIARLPT
jgi:hypothetical protein